MRISDWSSDVCSSDLVGQRLQQAADVCEDLAEIAGFLLRLQGARLDPRKIEDVADDGLQTAGGVVDVARIGGGLVDRLLPRQHLQDFGRSEEHTSELQSLMRISYAVFCLKKKKNNIN